VGAIFEFYVEDDTVLMGRLLGRRMHSETGAIHHVTSLAAGGADPLSRHDHDHHHEQRSSYIRREDDQDEAEIEKRMRSFKRFMPQIRQTLRQFSKGTCASWRHCFGLRCVALTFDGLRSSHQLRQ